eukprot:TRINITY_DN20276_c0_g2_i1.p1 TRINITY_DN20276_c0_g2~~TRINITY_DN20276_c0_g2_i1.p1  ORF type:complete len:455 (-),score=65.63 TRINITY_DN20276_c0_g2_i1:86-1450(-)
MTLSLHLINSSVVAVGTRVVAAGAAASWLLFLAGTATAAVVAAWTKLLKEPKLPAEGIEQLARQLLLSGDVESEPALAGYTAVVTGATAGLGEALSMHLYGLGASVVLVGRSVKKLEDTMAKMRSSHPSSTGTISTELADMADLESVSLAGARLVDKHKEIDLLVNNAGINYHGDMFRPWKKLASPQGYDLCFASNYLGHFLLTQILTKHLLNKPGSRILQIASSYHWQSTGSDLKPGSGDEPPFELAPRAAQADPGSYISRVLQRNLAYGNSKLAQILHARKLQRIREEYSNATGKVSGGPLAISCCPLFVMTGMTSGGLSNFFVERMSFPVGAALYALLGAVFLPASRLGSTDNFVCNSNCVQYLKPHWHLASRLASWIGLRQFLAHGLVPLILLLQRPTYGCHMMKASPESYDEVLQDALFTWSVDATAPYMSGEKFSSSSNSKIGKQHAF